MAIEENDEALSLHRKLSEAAKAMLSSVLPDIKAQRFSETAQDESKASYVGRRTPEDGRLDWKKPAQTAAQPGARRDRSVAGRLQLCRRTHKFIVWKSRVRTDLSPARAGTVLSVAPLVVACGEGRRWRS